MAACLSLLKHALRFFARLSTLVEDLYREPGLSVIPYVPTGQKRLTTKLFLCEEKTTDLGPASTLTSIMLRCHLQAHLVQGHLDLHVEEIAQGALLANIHFLDVSFHGSHGASSPSCGCGCGCGCGGGCHRLKVKTKDSNILLFEEKLAQ